MQQFATATDRAVNGGLLLGDDREEIEAIAEAAWLHSSP
jgi:hypothetical protein